MSRINVFLNELDVSVRDWTYVEKISKIISELKDDTNDFNDNFENNDFENNDFENNDFDVENNNVEDNNIEDNEIKNAKKDKILNYIFQSLNEKTIAKFLVNITLSKFA